MSETRSPADPEIVREALEAVAEMCRRHDLSALDGFLESCRSFAEEKLLNVAVVGRFKAGKSTFLNHLLGRSVLPVGVIPVTAAVTEIQYGPRERAGIHFLDGRIEEVSVDRIGEFITETQNPGNSKHVAAVRVELPSMERFRGIRFVDTPGLESVFEHNTDTSLHWLPNVGLALVAVGVDPPLSQHDIELIRNLSRFTPNISILLTKVDVLNESEQVQVQDFVQKQLARYWNGAVPMYPYSVRPGFEDLRSQLQDGLLARVDAEAGAHREAILRHKIDSLLEECAGYLTVALQAAEIADSERAQLRDKILGQKETIEDTRLTLRLAARHTAGANRSTFENILKADELPIRQRLLASLDEDFPSWTRNLRTATERFEDWLGAGLASEMSQLSVRHRDEFVAPVRRAGRQLTQALQDFRNRLSERTLETLGVPLRTTEMELAVQEPRSPDVRVGKIFDHNWELLSALVPMTIIEGLVKRHYERKVADAVFTNLSRLTTQWEEAANASLLALEKEAVRRLDSLVATIERMILSATDQAPVLRSGVQRLEYLRNRLRQ